YLRWAGVRDAADDKAPYGVNAERAMEFYSNETTKRLYKEHVAKIAARRNTVTGLLYRDDPTIFSYELMNEAQAPTGRWGERRAWMAEMSAYLKSLDPNHMIESGSWAYRSALERRAWLEEQKIPTLDYCDVHNYPRDDRDTYVTSPRTLFEFLENRAAAAFSINKPLVVGEFGMSPDGFEGASQLEWFRALYDAALRTGTSGATFWILTPDPQRGYGVSYTTARDEDLRAEIARGASLLGARRDFTPPYELLRAGRHLVPRQFEFARAPGDPEAQPQLALVGDPTEKGRHDAGGAEESGDVKNAHAGGDANHSQGPGGANSAQGSGGAKNARTLVYRFNPESAARGRFEKLGGGEGYVWGSGVGFFEYDVPARAGWRTVSEIVVRAHIQPVIPSDAHGRFKSTRVTLFVNDRDCGSRLGSLEQPPAADIQEWRVSSLATRLAAARGRPLSIRFEVSVEADHPFGINISNFPEGYNAGDTKPVEVEIR
ncbi:MAG: cellulase family glycosylhydrolase, partial [Acidobacteriota bacterium]|nr:cellulase family glycosylhydrolase [Acidobacteriota bacterium]